jgi:hypothetical protein
VAVKPPPLRAMINNAAGLFSQVWAQWFNDVDRRIDYLEKMPYAWGYLIGTTETISVVDTYQSLSTLHTIGNSNEFIASVNYPIGLKYTGNETLLFEVDWHASISSNSNNSTVYFTLFKNGVEVSGGENETFCKNQNQIYNLSSTAIVELSKDDEVQFKISCDSLHTITIARKNASIRRFN